MKCIYLLILVSTLSLIGCSSSSEPAPENQPPLIQSETQGVELYMSRNSLSKAEFEHYRLINDRLFYECGVVTRGRFFPSQQNIEPISNTYRNAILNYGDEMLEYIDKFGPKFEAPGKNKNMFDPGVFTLSLDTERDIVDIKTNFDWASESSAQGAKKLKNLAKTFRSAVGGEPCGNKEFFGINVTLPQSIS